MLVTGTNEAVAKAEAVRIADAIWSERAGFKFGVPADNMPNTILAAAEYVCVLYVFVFCIKQTRGHCSVLFP